MTARQQHDITGLIVIVEANCALAAANPRFDFAVANATSLLRVVAGGGLNLYAAAGLILVAARGLNLVATDGQLRVAAKGPSQWFLLKFAKLGGVDSIHEPGEEPLGTDSITISIPSAANDDQQKTNDCSSHEKYREQHGIVAAQLRVCVDAE